MSTALTPIPTNRPSLLHRLESILQPLDLEGLFAVHQPIELELGSGDGSFIAQYAQRHPERNFIGVERLLGRMRKIDRKGRRAGLQNLRLVRIEAGYFVEYLLPAAQVQAVHVYFPDPWPKRKHRHHRLINDRFPELARRILIPGGTVFLRTDDEDYFQQMTEVFARVDTFLPIETPDELASLVTDFECDFNEQGIATRRAAFQLRG